MNVRRPLTVAAGVVASIALAAGPASAHFCCPKHLNEHAAAGMAGSNGYLTLESLVTEIGLCSVCVRKAARSCTTRSAPVLTR